MILSGSVFAESYLEPLDQNVGEKELWEETAEKDFIDWYPEILADYTSKNGDFKTSADEEAFKKEAWIYFWNVRREQIDASLGHSFPFEHMIDAGSVRVSSKVRNRILKSGVPRKAFDRALKKMGSSVVKKKDRMVIIDFSKKATERRFYYINLKSGAVERHHVSHGKNSGGFGARATRFSAKSGSHQTPPGFHVTGGRGGYKKKWGSAALILEGIERINRNSRAREIVAHGASYVSGGGRSNGCPALDRAVAKRLLPQLTNGVLWYHYTGK